eukprot:6225606-Amphidinium_carterae.1
MTRTVGMIGFRQPIDTDGQPPVRCRVNFDNNFFEKSSNATFPSSTDETEETSNADTSAQCTA